MCRGDQHRLGRQMVELAKVAHHLVFQLYIAARKIEKNLPLRCHTDRTARTIKRCKAQLLFNLIQLFGECWLRDKQTFRRLGDISAFFYFENIMENACIHGNLRNRCLNSSISESE